MTELPANSGPQNATAQTANETAICKVSLKTIIEQVKSNYEQVEVTLKPKSNSAQLYLSDYRYWVEVWSYDSEFQLWVVAYDKTLNVSSFVYDQTSGEYFYYKNPSEFSYDNLSKEDSDRLVETIISLLKDSAVEQPEIEQQTIEQITTESPVSEWFDSYQASITSPESITSEQAIVKQALLDAYNSCRDGRRTQVKSNLNFTSATDTDLLRLISDSAKITESLDREEKLALRNLKKISKNFKIERGYLWISSFCEIRARYDNFKTDYNNDEFTDECSKEISDIEYPITEENIENFVRKNFWYGTMDFYALRNIVLSVETLKNDGNIICLECNGDGFVRCKKCDGSGRESYTQGYFANGEKKINTGQCSKCYGNGTIKCSTCSGQGKVNFKTETYQRIKTCVEKPEIQRSYHCSTSFGDQEVLESAEKWLGDTDSCKLGVWSLVNTQTLCDGITKLNKSQNVPVIDVEKSATALSILQKIGQEYEYLYTQNRKAFEQKEYGDLICSMEQNCAIPIVQISGTTKYYMQSDYKFHLIDLSGLDGEGDVEIFCSYYPLAKLLHTIF